MHLKTTPAHSQNLPALAAVVLDLDGVLYLGKTPISGAAKIVTWLLDQGLKVYYLTNNSTQTRANYVQRLNAMGIFCKKDMVYSSSYACALYLQKQSKAAPTALVVGEGGLAGELTQAGIKVVRRLGGKRVDYVVVGMDRKINYAKIRDAQQAILQGAKFIASNRDPVYPTEHGVTPGGGTIVAAIQTASQQKPLLIGKPSPFILKLLLNKEKLAPESVLLVGDRLDTDIACGRRSGVRTALVLTGVTSRREAEEAPARMKPHWILESIADLPKLLGGSK